jgi:Putative restriction endonuclease
MTTAQSQTYTVTWEKLPDDYILPDDPVDNRTQPALAAALTESLALNDRLSSTASTTTNYGICATVNGKIVVKAPDWCLIPAIRVPLREVERSYTPRLEGDNPLVVMEFLSDTPGTEYSIKPSSPVGKWFFYERILQVPNYVIFDPEDSVLEVYRLSSSGLYDAQPPNQQQRFWIPDLQLFLGVWQGTRQDRTGNWLRWWDEAGNLLLWGGELAEQERQRAERLAARLRELGEDPDLL